jgi:hypothetical protein
MATVDRDDLERFVNTYVPAFLAAYAASNYSEAYALDQHDRLTSPPVEDAVHLAVCAWLALREVDLDAAVDLAIRLQT